MSNGVVWHAGIGLLSMHQKVKTYEQVLPLKYWKVQSNIIFIQLLLIVFKCNLLAQVCRTCCVNMQNGGLQIFGERIFGEREGRDRPNQLCSHLNPLRHRTQNFIPAFFHTLYAGF